jgi:putative ABC transport system ATP-binding protein
MTVLELQGVSKIYGDTVHSVPVLKAIDLAIMQGDFIAIVGPSGSGKTTLLTISALLDQPTSGIVKILGQPTQHLNWEQRAAIRRKYIAVVFQNFQLIEQLTILENVALPLRYAGIGRAERLARATAVLGNIGLADRRSHYPLQLSGGQQQRAAIARAIVNEPALLFADEPTGNLDRTTAQEVMVILHELNSKAGTTIILVTHDSVIAAEAKSQIHCCDGKIAMITPHLAMS